jgi:hypothetical protein
LVADLLHKHILAAEAKDVELLVLLNFGDEQ